VGKLEERRVVEEAVCREHKATRRAERFRAERGDSGTRSDASSPAKSPPIELDAR
jgi:hypothetical protein